MISWQYLAGFFDGEGSVSMGSNHKYGYSLNVQFPQAGDEGAILLNEIKDFLMSEGISTNKVFLRMKSSPLSKKSDNRLFITKREEVVKFLVKIVPYLRIKRIKAQDFIRTAKLYPPLPKGGRLTWESRRANQET